MAILKLNKGINIKLSENFSSGEFDCKCTNPDCKETLVDTDLVEKLQSLRDALGVPLYINSGFRCMAHNQAVMGSANSQHLLGRAVDITGRNRVTIDTILAHAIRLWFTGIGKYPTFAHLDTREGGPVKW